jgi:class 3 adenylate cyclase
MDFAPRRLTFEQTESLRRLSHQVLAQLELRRKLIEYDNTIRELNQARLEAAAERARAEELLGNVLPAPIADELKRSGRVQPKYLRSATILFADIQGFTLLAERTEPARLIDLLDQYFSALDEICARYGLEKVKTIGDAYMAVAGVLAPDRRHPIDVCLAALDMLTLVDRFRARCETIGEHAVQLRIGIHTGPDWYPRLPEKLNPRSLDATLGVATGRTTFLTADNAMLGRQRGNEAADILAHLLGRRCQAGYRSAIRPGRACISDDKDVGVTENGKVRLDDDPVGPVVLGVKPLCCLRGPNAGRPYNCLSVDPLRTKRHAAFGAIRHARLSSDLNAHIDQ